jgi:hypothetical protein
MPRCSLRCAGVPSAQGAALCRTPPVELLPGERKETARRPGRFAASDSRKDEKKLLARVAYHRS